jgi:hypothetical protein
MKSGNRIAAKIPGGSGEQVRLTIATTDGREMISADALK